MSGPNVLMMLHTRLEEVGHNVLRCIILIGWPCIMAEIFQGGSGSFEGSRDVLERQQKHKPSVRIE